MNNIRLYIKKHPAVLCISGLVAVWVAVRMLPKISCGGLTVGVNEAVSALLVYLVYWILMGERDLKPDFRGFRYGFSVMKYLFVILAALALFNIVQFVIAALQPESGASLIPLLNSVIACSFVGIVEEFSFRGMVFGGLCSCFGRTRKSIIVSALLSSFLFGFIHVASEFFSGEIKSALEIAMAAGKTVQAGLIGFLFAIIYIRTRSIWTVALLHGLNDLFPFLMNISKEMTEKPKYILSTGDADAYVAWAFALAYVVLIIISLPAVLRGMRELGKEPEPYVIPLDEDFVPRDLIYEKRRKKANA